MNFGAFYPTSKHMHNYPLHPIYVVALPEKTKINQLIYLNPVHIDD